MRVSTKRREPAAAIGPVIYRPFAFLGSFFGARNRLLQAHRPLKHHLAMAKPPPRLVYTSQTGRVCPKCGWPATDCRCALPHPAGNEPVPARLVFKLRIEKTGRGGKTVTVIDGLPHNAPFAAELAQELKRGCGTGGALRDGALELQGDLRDRVRELLTRKGYVVKG
jgi:translation initiation factor 1